MTMTANHQYRGRISEAEIPCISPFIIKGGAELVDDEMMTMITTTRKTNKDSSNRRKEPASVSACTLAFH